MSEVTRFLTGYAARMTAPIETRTTVTSVTHAGNDYHVSTDRGDWTCGTLVLASGACNRADIPPLSAGIPPGIVQLDPLHDRPPAQLRPGGVLVVGASATGVQIAAERRAAGHDVLLSAGQHIRGTRRYSGRDIQWWFDRSGLLSAPADTADDLAGARALPSLQLVGDASRRFLDLNALQATGVEVTGRLAAHRDGIVAPGLGVLGLPFLRRRKSSLIDGVGADAAALADRFTKAGARQPA